MTALVLVSGWGVAFLWLSRMKMQIILLLLYLEFLALNIVLIMVFAIPVSGDGGYPLLFSFFVLTVSGASFGLAMLVSFYRAHGSALLSCPKNL